MLRRIVVFCLLAMLPGMAVGQKPASPPANGAEAAASEEYAVYGAAIAGLFDEGKFKDRRLLIENRTVSFECGQNACNLLDVGNGCSGMREPGQDPDAVLRNFRQTMTLLEQSTWHDFKKNNEHCSALHNDFPVKHDYLWMDDSTQQAMIGKQPASELSELQQAAWATPDKVFLSQPGFNADRTQALLYLAVVCHEQCSWSGYLLLGRVNGEWTAVGHYTAAGQ